MMSFDELIMNVLLFNIWSDDVKMFPIQGMRWAVYD